MDYVRIGSSGVKVSRICLGTLTFGREANESMCFRILDRFREEGGNFIDTSNIYGMGASEEIVGRWIRKRGVRDEMILATKVYQTTGPGPNDSGLSRLHIQRAVKASLKRLQTDVIDLYQIHWWDPNTPVEETLGALDDLVRQNTVRYLGCSNIAAWQISKYLRVADRHNWSRFISVQPCYNALNRSIESEILPLCRDEGLGIIPYHVLAGGMLSGKYKRGKPLPGGSRLEVFQIYQDLYYTEYAQRIAEGFVEAARERSVTPTQLALAWVLAEPLVTSPIIGVRNLEQFNEVIGGLKVNLSPEERSKIPSVPPGRWVGKDSVYERDIPPIMDIPGTWDPNKFKSRVRSLRKAT